MGTGEARESESWLPEGPGDLIPGAPWVSTRQHGPPGPGEMAPGTGSGGNLTPTMLQDLAIPNELPLFLAVSQTKPSKEKNHINQSQSHERVVSTC